MAKLLQKMIRIDWATKIMKCEPIYQQIMNLFTIFLNSWNMLSIFALMNTICQHIEFLVRNHDCVIVPGWGAFIANFQPAHFDKFNRLMPPSRTLSFNSSLVHDDGLLASSIVRREKISYDKALNIIAEEVNALRHQLTAQREVVLGHLGIFTYNAEGSMLFEPYEKSSAVSSLYGLPIVNAVSLRSQVSNEENEANKKNGDTIYVPIRRSWTRIAASIAVILGLGFTLSTPIINDQAHQASIITAPIKPQIKLIEPAPDANLVLNISNIDSIQAKAVVDTVYRKQYQAVMAYYKQREEQRRARREEMMRQIEEQRQAIAAQTTPNKVEAQSSQPITQPVAQTNLRFNSNDAYCLIVASLPTRALAEQFISQAGNGQFGILEQEGRYRVYAATGETSSQTYDMARNNGLMKRYKGAWVCRK